MRSTLAPRGTKAVLWCCNRMRIQIVDKHAPRAEQLMGRATNPVMVLRTNWDHIASFSCYEFARYALPDTDERPIAVSSDTVAVRCWILDGYQFPQTRYALSNLDAGPAITGMAQLRVLDIVRRTRLGYHAYDSPAQLPVVVMTNHTICSISS
eukprot:516840-Rhodomonas_salina.6